MKNRVAIISAGRTYFGELFDRSLISLTVEAGLKALRDANLERRDIDEMYVGSFVSEITNFQGNFPALLCEELGIHIPITRVEAACGSGGSALYNGIRAVSSGDSDIVLVGGVEKATDTGSAEMFMAAASPWERLYGFSFAGLYANMANRYLYNNQNTTAEHLAMVAVKNHRHARNNPYAHYRNAVTVEQVQNTPMVSSPFTILHCSPISDGGAAVILASEKIAKEYDDAVYITGAAMNADAIGLYARRDMTTSAANRFASRDALARAGRTVDEVDIFELHDAFTISEIMAMEDIKLAAIGCSAAILERGLQVSSNGSHVVMENSVGREFVSNAGGGLKADGHPVGATGVRQAVEIYQQLAGKSEYPVEKVLGDRPMVGLCQNVGGTCASSSVHVMEVMN